MKQRTTFLASDGESTNPANFNISSDALHIKSLLAAREDRITLGFDELPPEIWAVLKTCSELHLRWTTSRPYTSVDPFAPRIPAGLQVIIAPQRETTPSICGLLNKAFGIESCKSFESSFSEIPGSYQFYDPLSSISTFRSYLQDLICAGTDVGCRERLQSMETADYVDIKYDAVSQSLVISSFWSQPSAAQSIKMELHEHGNVEVGVLGHEKPMADESFTLGGVLHVVGRDGKLNPVLFTFPSRHHRYPFSFSLDILQPAGLHPKLNLTISSPLEAPHEDCTLNAYFTLPRSLFVDKYQLSFENTQLLESLNIVRLRDVSGESDLEAPVWANDLWGSSLLVEIDTSHRTDHHLAVELPLHLRYLEPRPNTTSSEVQFASPAVFWACRSEEWSKMPNSPFDKIRLGWEHLFPEQTMYHHLSPSGGGWKMIEVPVLDLKHAAIVKFGTVAVIIGGFLWVCWKIVAATILTKNTTAPSVKKNQ